MPARDRKMMRTAALYLGLMVAVFGVQGLTQEKPKDLSPSEAYKAAIAPFNAARSQANDLTDADKLALGIGMTQASRDCLALSTNTSALATDAKELFALGQLCIFGQQFEAARGTLVEYLALPQPPERKQALQLLVRALLGLRDPGSAEPQVRSLLRDYPYDAQIHFAIDQVIDAAEGAGPRFNDLVLQLCSTQDAATIPLLSDGKALEGKDGNASAAVLFTDAVRCAALGQQPRKASEQGSLRQLATIVQQPSWAGTADLAPMQAALQRQQMIGVQNADPFAARTCPGSEHTCTSFHRADAGYSAPGSIHPLVPERPGCGSRSCPVRAAATHRCSYKLEREYWPRGCAIQ